MSNREADDIRIRRLTEAEFLRADRNWCELLNNSDADPLFSSWLWQTTWWRCFGERHALELFIVVAERENGRLVGIAPMFRHIGYIKSFFPVRRIEFIGNIFRGSSTARGEYLGLILRRGFENETATAVLDYILEGKRCQELVLSDVRTGSVTHRTANDYAIRNDIWVRPVDYLSGFTVILRGTFDRYVEQLSGSTRRQLYNKRTQLKKFGTVTIKEITENTQSEFFQELNRLHKMRWGKDVFQDRALEFQRILAKAWLRRREFGGTILYVGDRPVSALLDICAGKRQYNIQSGFDPTFGTSLSLGLLHLGYAIESSFGRGLESYELLVGGGKNSQYKARLVADRIEVQTLQFIRSRWLEMVYRSFVRISFRQKNAGEKVDWQSDGHLVQTNTQCKDVS